MKLRRLRKRGQLMPAGPQLPTATASRKKKPMIVIISIITLVVIAALLLLFLRRGPTVGKAFQVVTPTPTGDVNTVWADPFTLAHAAPGDTFSINIMFRTDPATDAVTGATFTLDYDQQFTLQSAAPGTGFLLISDAMNIQSGSSVSLMSTSGVAGAATLVTLRFAVTGEYDQQEPTHSFIGTFTDFSGVKDTTGDGNVESYNIVDTSSTPLVASANVVIAKVCDDTDGDGFGEKDTDLRACPNAGPKDGTGDKADCEDDPAANGAKIYPGATEDCDGVINDCNNPTATDGSGVTAPLTEKQQGICFALQQQCVNGQFENNYNSQLPLYEDPESTCDHYDNDCDGSVNQVDEDTESSTWGLSTLPDCTFGGEPSLVGSPPGNVYVDYNADNTHKVPQDLTTDDRKLLNRLISLLEDTATNCGLTGMPPCSDAWSSTTTVHYCSNGVYYLEITSGAQAGDVYKYSPTEDLNGPLITGNIENCA